MDKWRGRCTAVLSFLASTYAWPTHCVCVYICMYARRFDQRAAHAARYTRSNGRLDHNGDETGKEIYDFRFKLTTCKRQELDASKTQHRRCTHACMYRKKTWDKEQCCLILWDQHKRKAKNTGSSCRYNERQLIDVTVVRRVRLWAERGYHAYHHPLTKKQMAIQLYY